MRGKGYRSEFDSRSEKIGYKIREWEYKKVPYMVILGDKEKSNNNISVRAHLKGDLGNFELTKFLETIEKENNVIQ